MTMQKTMDIDAVHKLLGKRKAVGGRDSTRYGKRHQKGVMNKTEQAYADILEGRRLAGEIVCWLFESVTLKVADDCRITIDFMVMNADGSIEFVDTKGPAVDPTSITKIKVAAEKFFMFTFVTEQKLAKNAGWKRTVF